MSEEEKGTKARKDEHLSVVKKEKIEFEQTTTWFEHVHLIHQALPEIRLSDVDASTEFLGFKLAAPLLIDCMTGGTENGKEANRAFASAAKSLGLGMGVGSERVAIFDENAVESFAVVRDVAPDIFVMGNIGGAQLAKGLSIDQVKKAVEIIKANALVIHLNPLQELVQPEGEPEFAGVLERIKEVVKALNVPIIVKEVGAGISREVAVKLQLAGVSAINVAGAGGTSWAKIEGLRAKKSGNDAKYELSKLFGEWGIPTAASIIEVRSVSSLPIIASGGIRNGLHVAKSIALGADVSAMALPVMKEYMKDGEEGVVKLLSRVIEEYRAALFLTGARTTKELKEKRRILTGPLAEWARQVGYA